MGNKAVVAFGAAWDSPAIYLHWNGGRASVEAFLEAARDLGLRHVETGCRENMQAAAEKMAGMISRHFFDTKPGSGGSVSVTTFMDGDVENNGSYVIGRDMKIIGRFHAREVEEIDAQKTADIVAKIKSRAPVFND